MSLRLGNLNPYDQHKLLINEYILNKPGRTALLKRDTSRDRTDDDVIRENHRFLWSDDDDDEDSWEKELAKKYYDKLFKEYAICDLSRYKENKVALRWRTEKEVIVGKGQFECGHKPCTVHNGLKSWEVNFAYAENGEKKNALIKIRLCPECSQKLNYRSQKREVKRAKRMKKFIKNIKKGKIPSDTNKDDDDNDGASGSTGTSGQLEEKQQKSSEGYEEDEDFHVISQYLTEQYGVMDKSTKEHLYGEYLKHLLL